MNLAKARARRERDEAWYKGDLSYLLKKHAQTQLYNFIYDFKEKHPKEIGPVVCVAARRTGKSTVGGILGFERALKRPGAYSIFLAPLEEQSRKIVRPIVHWLLKDCPKHIKIQPRRDQVFFNNPEWHDERAISTFNYFGADASHGNKLRGIPSAEYVYLDEVRDCEYLEYLIDSILIYTFKGMPDPLMWMGSTLPEDTDHPLIQRFLPDAKEHGRLIVLPKSLNPDWSKDDSDAIVNATGRPLDSEENQRELECIIIQNRETAIIPEWDKLKATVLCEHPRPRYFIPRVAIDGGFFPDPLAAIFYYVDFVERILVVEDELLMHRPTTTEFALTLLDREESLFAENPRPVMRVADLKNFALEDLRRDQSLLKLLREKKGRNEGIYASQVPTHDRAVSLRQLRSNFANVRIHPRCKELVYQLTTATLDKKGDFIRSRRLGHCDLIACLRSAVRMINWDENPYPTTWTKPDPNSFTSPRYRPPLASTMTHNQTMTHFSFGIRQQPETTRRYR